jgi:Peptide methionine sulfoxide reductase
MAFAEHLAPTSLEHFVFGRPIIDQNRPMAVHGMGCFWGAERIFWKTPGITATRHVPK